MQPHMHRGISARKQAMKDYADKKSYVSSVIDLKVGDSVLS